MPQSESPESPATEVLYLPLAVDMKPKGAHMAPFLVKTVSPVNPVIRGFPEGQAARAPILERCWNPDHGYRPVVNVLLRNPLI